MRGEYANELNLRGTVVCVGGWQRIDRGPSQDPIPLGNESVEDCDAQCVKGGYTLARWLDYSIGSCYCFEEVSPGDCRKEEDLRSTSFVWRTCEGSHRSSYDHEQDIHTPPWVLPHKDTHKDTHRLLCVTALTGDDLLISAHQYYPTCNLVDVDEHTRTDYMTHCRKHYISVVSSSTS